ncbi:FMN-dependent NADH-azoreductase [Niastella yeongjuensis]|uniref:FMN dependent NADH:quinone oxidoreductase n=1 Tax=Niastella yeongjuensis TaxID=354355 RepID=A0A1V9EF66_9BACT|nr:NAD(P)H-dependent oxidoreductase [Niastella yeongjuensis]OQP44756.1 FMN-dependent NADH-azoreductase [Niastella yeongjuensis]SEP42682.1 FMN-dependent NADH-azoreductase [Niastella yeongjuensis]
MKKILNIVSSAKGNNSYSIKLSNAIIDKLLAAYPDSQVKTHDLTANPLPHLFEDQVAAFYTPAEQRTDDHKKLVSYSDQAIQDLKEADFVVIGVPLYNFNIPSSLKSWIDNIVRHNITFKYENGAPQGMVVNKKVYLAMATGGIYSEGPMKPYDFAEPFLRFILSFIGLNDITTFRVEGTAIPDLANAAFPKAVETVNEHVF